MKRITFAALLLTTTSGIFASGVAQAREWTDSTGKMKVEAEYVGVKDGKVLLRKPDGQIAQVPVSRLSDADQAFVKTQPALATSRPKVEEPTEKAAEVKDRFDLAVQQNPRDPAAYFQRAMARTNAGKTEEAIKDFNEAIRLKPNFAAAYDGRGLALSKEGKALEAHSNFDKAIEIDPDLASAYRNRGDNIEKMWDTPEGKALLKERSESYRKKYEMARGSNLSKTPWQPLNTTSGNVLASALQQMRQVDYERAREIEAAYGGGEAGISLGGIGIGGANVKIVGPGVAVTAPGSTVVGNPALSVYPEEVTQGQTITLVANPAELQKAMPAQLDDNGKPIRRRGAYGEGPPKEPVYAVDFYRDVDGDGILNPDADEYLASDTNNKDGFTAEVSTDRFPPGNQAYFAMGRGKQPAGVPATYEQAAEAMKKAAATQRDIAAASEKAKEAGYTTEQAQELQELQERIGETTKKMAQAYAQTTPQAAKDLASAVKPMTAVDNRLKAAEKRPGETSKTIANSATEKANEAADLLDKVAAMLAEKADSQGEGGPSPAAPAGAAAAASGKINPPTSAPAEVASAPGKPGPGKPAAGGDYGNDRDYGDDDGDIIVRRDDDDDRDIIIYDDDDDIEVRETVDRALGFIDDDDYDGAVRVYDDYLVDNDDDLVLRQRADTLVARGSYDYAVRDYDRLETGGYVMTADLYYNRGCAHLAAGRIEAAIEDFNKSIGLDETRNLAYTNRGTAFARSGEFGLAISDFNSALELNSRDTLAIRNRALAYKKLGKLEQAEADLARLRELTQISSGE